MASVVKMVFISHCWSNKIRPVEALIALVVLLAAACGCMMPARAAANDAASQVSASVAASAPGALPFQARANGVMALTVERSGSGALLLSTQLDFLLPAAVREALIKGVPVYFIAEADIIHPRWYWTDQRLVHARRYWRISYLPLTRRWRLASSSEPLSDEGIGTGLAQHYDSLDSAVVALQRITGWHVADAAVLNGGGTQLLTFSFKLDTAQLPRTLQIGMAGQADWRLHIEQRVDLAQVLVPPPSPSSSQPQQPPPQQQDSAP